MNTGHSFTAAWGLFFVGTMGGAYLGYKQNQVRRNAFCSLLLMLLAYEGGEEGGKGRDDCVTRAGLLDAMEQDL